MELFDKDSRYYERHYGEYDERIFQPVSDKMVSSTWSIDILKPDMIDYDHTFKRDDMIYVCLGNQLDIAAKMGSFVTRDGIYIDDLLPLLFQTAPCWEISAEEAIEENIIPDDLIAESGVADTLISGLGNTYIYVQINPATNQFRYIYVNNQEVCAVDIDSIYIDNISKRHYRFADDLTSCRDYVAQQKKKFTYAVLKWFDNHIIR